MVFRAFSYILVVVETPPSPQKTVRWPKSMDDHETGILSLARIHCPVLPTTGIANFQLVSVVFLQPFVFFRCLLVNSLRPAAFITSYNRVIYQCHSPHSPREQLQDTVELVCILGLAQQSLIWNGTYTSVIPELVKRSLSQPRLCQPLPSGALGDCFINFTFPKGLSDISKSLLVFRSWRECVSVPHFCVSYHPNQPSSG